MAAERPPAETHPPEREHEERHREERHREEQAKEAEKLDAKTTYEVIRREGEHELERTSGALFWSGLAAGLSMGFSFLVDALLRTYLPDATWRPLVAKLGYTVGFVIVIVGSQQLFTENTLTPIVPLLSKKSSTSVSDVGRLWSVVFVANMIGVLLFALVLGRLPVVEPDVQRALSDIAAEAMRPDVWTTLLRAVYAGWLIALMVWMLPGAETSKIAVIVIMTWVIGVAGFAHVIAGGTEVFYAAVRGEASWADAIVGFIAPTLVGNIFGGVTLVAGLNHAQAEG
ncbi:MAG TPA: formate/nitrite transporter family protein [Gemmatimonadaceae bacterium]|jgi:formate/nitrite transporter FocA (FNT family)|nr:formate/nitrite transporter family protein [Gemmatimonadaceae bacterium]